MTNAPAPAAAPQLELPAAAPIDYATWSRLLSGQRLPCAMVDLDALDRNILRVRRLLEAAGGRHQLRLATKSVRVPQLISRILAAGPPFAGLMCFSAAEAGFLASQGFDDLLLAYPTVQAADLNLLRALHQSGRTIRLVVDSADTARRVDEMMQGASTPFPLVLDLDLSLRLLWGRAHLGVRRSPLRSLKDIESVVQAIQRLHHVKVVGFMGYEAQVAGLGDRNPFKRLLNPIAGWIRRRSARLMNEQRGRVAASAGRWGLAIELFNGGGTGSVNWAAREPWLSEVTVGSAFLCSHLFDYYSNVRFEPAAFFALQVTRSSDSGYVTCQSGGYVASGEPGWDKVPLPYLPKGLRLLPSEGCGEVQTPLALPEGVWLSGGSPVVFRHAKAGELAEHFNEYLLVSQGELVGTAPTYRGLGQCFG